MKKVFTIAGSDSSGGAGMQADLKTFQELGVYGMSALTAIVSMDSDDWSHRVFPISVDTVKAQIETVVTGIGVDAMKTGMLPSSEIIELVAQTVTKHKLKNVVVDPVMVCKGTDEPLNPESAECYRKVLVPLATVVTPNIFEASQLSGIKQINTIDDMKNAAHIIKESGVRNVVIKGGKGIMHEKAVDIVYDGKRFEVLESDKINTSYTHGAGCTFSAAIAAVLAKGFTVFEAVSSAKAFVAAAILRSFRLNQFVGTLDRSAKC